MTDDWSTSIVDCKLPQALDGVSITIAGQPAFPAYISPTQINAQVPYGVSGAVTVVVSVDGVPRNSGNITVQSAGPGVFVLGQ